MLKKIIRGVSLILIPILIVTSTMVWYDQYLDKRINAEYNPALGRTYGVDEMNKGIKLLQHNAEAGDLLILGSSELDAKVPQNPQYMFPNTELNCNVDLVGRASVQSLLDCIKVSALSDSFKNKKVVLVVSLQWFLGSDIDAAAYKAHFSEIQFYKLMNNKNINEDVKQYICTRTVKLAANESSLERPYTYAYLYQRNDVFFQIALNCLKPYYYIRENFLDLKDKYDSYKAIQNFKNEPIRKPLQIDWNQEEIKAQEMGKKACTNNDFYVYDEYYSTYLQPKIEQLKNCSVNTEILKSKEFDDYRLLLEIFKQQGIKPYIIFTPANGLYYDYIGIDKEKRAAYYEKVKALTAPYQFDYLDLSDKEYEPYFLKDVMHLGWKGWLYVDKKITEYFSAGK